MTDDEILFALNNAIGHVEDYRAQLETRLRGKKVAYYGQTFRITTVTAELCGNVCGAYASGPILKKDGSPHMRHRGSMRVDRLEFVD
jgi:hypothetical protein